jgi:hypothetical protein
MLGPPIAESSLTDVTIPSAAARTGVFSLTMRSTAFLSFPICAGEDVLSILCNAFFGTGSEQWLLALISQKIDTFHAID